jgi:hypothetical protein
VRDDEDLTRIAPRNDQARVPLSIADAPVRKIHSALVVILASKAWCASAASLNANVFADVDLQKASCGKAE